MIFLNLRSNIFVGTDLGPGWLLRVFGMWLEVGD